MFILIPFFFEWELISSFSTRYAHLIPVCQTVILVISFQPNKDFRTVLLGS